MPGASVPFELDTLSKLERTPFRIPQVCFGTMKLGGILPGSQFLLPPNPAIYCLNPWLTVHE